MHILWRMAQAAVLFAVCYSYIIKMANIKVNNLFKQIFPKGVDMFKQVCYNRIIKHV